jgi:hypothetical protein
MSWCKPVKALRDGPRGDLWRESYRQFVLKTAGVRAECQIRLTKTLSTESGQTREKGRTCVPNRKGCDLGYAPALSSCEGANSVDACTIAALDAITAFAVPNPNCSSQNQSVFSGLVARQVTLLSGSLSLLRSGKIYFANPFSCRRSQIKQSLHRCQRNSQRENEISVNGIVENVAC